MKISLSSRLRTLVGSLVLAATIAVTAAPASAVDQPYVVKGDACLGGKRVFVTGADVCATETARVAGYSVTYRYKAADTRSDGHSAREVIVVLQQINGNWVLTDQQEWTNSEGAGTTLIRGRYTYFRKPGATRLKVMLIACVYEAPLDRHILCGPLTEYAVVTW